MARYPSNWSVGSFAINSVTINGVLYKVQSPLSREVKKGDVVVSSNNGYQSLLRVVDIHGDTVSYQSCRYATDEGLVSLYSLLLVDVPDKSEAINLSE